MPEISLYPHQQRAIVRAARSLEQHRGFYVAHEPGLGKTLTALCVARLRDAKRVLVLTNVAGLGVWRAETERHWPGAVVAREVVEAHNLVRHNPYDKPVVLVINYDKLNGDRGLERLQTIYAFAPDLVVLDEAQNVKNHRSDRSSSVSGILKKSGAKALLLSGTPAHDPLDYWQQYQFVAPDEWPWNQRFTQYRSLVAVMGGPQQLWVQKYREKDVEKVQRAMLPHTDAEVIESLHLPEPIITPVPLSLGTSDIFVYRQMEKQMRVEFADGSMSDAQIILTKILRLQQITSGFLRKTDGTDERVGDAKFVAAMELIAERPKEKLIVAGRFRWELQRVISALVAAQRPFASITGDTPDDQRKKAEETFQSTDKPMVLVLQNQAGGVALTLTAADAMIVLSVDPSTITWRQLIGRVHRIGQQTHTQVLLLQADRSVDGDIFAALMQHYDTVKLARFVADGVLGRTT